MSFPMRSLNIVRSTKHVYSLVALSLGFFLIGFLVKSPSQWKSAVSLESVDSMTMSQACVTEPSLITSETVKRMKIPDRPTISGLEAWLRPDAARFGPALESIPEILHDAFTVNNTIPTFAQFFDQAYLGGFAQSKLWSPDLVSDLRAEVRERVEVFNYPNGPLYEALEKRGYLIQNKSGLVIGSESPWLEAMLIEFSAKHVTTLEYGKIISLDSRIDTYTPTEFIHGFLRGEIPQFDFAFTYSSVEHDGLGRYGDVLNPNGDLQTMARIMNFVKPGGFVFLGVPCCHDQLVWNAHRIYGPIRLPKLFAGYKVLGVYPEDSQISHENHGNAFGYQPVWLLQNRYGCEEFPRRKGPNLTKFGGAG